MDSLGLSNKDVAKALRLSDGRVVRFWTAKKDARPIPYPSWYTLCHKFRKRHKRMLATNAKPVSEANDKSATACSIDEPGRRIERVPRRYSVAITLPGSKSIALRQILMSLLAKRPTRLDGVPRCDDVDAMFRAAHCLGVGVRRQGETAWLTPPDALPDGELELDLGMSGVSLRLLLAVAALRDGTTRFSGHPQLRRRPNADLLRALEAIGCEVTSQRGHLPITVTGPATHAATTTLRTDVTSQYLSALLLTAPRLSAGLAIHLTGRRTSASYIDLTAAEMAKRGVAVRRVDDATVCVSNGEYRGGDVTIEGDASAATYHAALATLHGATVTFTNLGSGSRQGDYGFLAVCERAGATIERRVDATTVCGPARLSSVERVDMRDMPDAAPTLMAMAPFLPTPTHITGLATLRVKECDRIAAGAAELRKAGVNVREYDDAMTIHPATATRPAVFDTYEDHRMAMALSVLASKIGGCRILGEDCVAKTYRDYWQDFDRIYGPTPTPAA